MVGKRGKHDEFAVAFVGAVFEHQSNQTYARARARVRSTDPPRDPSVPVSPDTRSTSPRNPYCTGIPRAHCEREYM